MYLCHVHFLHNVLVNIVLILANNIMGYSTVALDEALRLANALGCGLYQFTKV